MDTKKLVEMVMRLDAATVAPAVRNDDVAAAFLSRQLTYVRAQTIDAKHAPLNAFSVFPVQTEISAGAATALQYYYDMVGMAQLIANPADDMPRADLIAREVPVSIKQFGDSYGYSVQDLENAAFARIPLSIRKGMAAKKAIDVKLNDLAWFGDSKAGIIGFLSNEDMTSMALAADGTGSVTALSAKTPAQMYRDVTDLIESIQVNTNETEIADTVLLAPATYRTLAHTLYITSNSAGTVIGQTNRTVLEMLQDQHPEIKRWMKIGELTAADPAGDVMIAGVFDPDYVRFEIPIRFDQRPVQEKNFEYIINCRASSCGVTTFRPYCFTKAVGA